MKRLARINFFRCLGMLSLLLVSQQSMAIGEIVAGQSVQNINIGLIAIASILVFIILSLMFAKLRLSKQNKILASQTEELDLRNSLLANFSVGILHLNSSGEVVYANKVASYYLGIKDSQLLYSPLLNAFSSDQVDKITPCISAKVDSNVQLYIDARKRHILFNFTPQTKVKNNIACIVAMQDVNSFQARIDQAQNTLRQNKALLDHSQLGQLSVNLEDNSFTVNQLSATLLDIDGEATTGDLKTFEAMIQNSDLYRWNQGLEQAKIGQPIEIQCNFQLANRLIPIQLFGLPALISDSSDSTQCTTIHFTLFDQSELAEKQAQVSVSKQKLKGILSSNPHPTYLLDKEGVILECNAAFEKLFSTRISKLQGQRLKDIEELPEAFRKLHNSDSSVSHNVSASKHREIDVELTDKAIHSLKLNLQQYRDNEQKRAGTVGFIEDVTAFKQTMKKLEQERQHFSEVIDMAPIAIAMLDEDDHVIQANHAMTERLGTSEKELKKASFYQLFEDSNNAGKAAKQLHQTGRLRKFQAKLTSKNGELLPSELHIDLFDKEKQQFLCWISDISVEQFQQDKFDSLLQHSSMPMAVLNDSGFNRLNPAACKFFGVEEETELFGLFPYSESLNEDEDQAKQLRRKIKQVKLDGQAQSIVWQHQKEDEVLPCHATYIPMYKGQDLDSILCVWMDLRALQKADQDRLDAINLHQAAEREIVEKQQLLISSQDQLAHKVKSLSAKESQLKAAKDSLSEEQTKFSDLQIAHQSMTDHLQTLQQDYSHNRELLEESERNNSELESQLENSVKKVGGLERQRNQIADALQNSERQYQRAEQELAESEKTTQRLQEEQQQQQVQMEEFVNQIDKLKQSIQQKDQQINQVSGQINALQSQLTSSGQTSEKLRQLLINQRKASEQAEKQRKVLEQDCLHSQSEVSNKARQIDHLKHEMHKFEEMSNQQKGDMQQQQTLLQQELEAKQQQLQDTQQALDDTKRLTELEKAEKQEQQAHLEKLQEELAEVEQRNTLQQQQLENADQHWQQQQQELQHELREKQQQLLQTEQALTLTKQQTEAEKAERERQQKTFEKLQSELAEMELRSAKQQAQIAENEKQWQQNQIELQREVESKQQQLQSTQQALNENKQQTDKEKQQQQAHLKKLQDELADAEKRSQQQDQQIQDADKHWQEQQRSLENELLKKQQRLLQTEQALRKTKQQTMQQTEAEKAERERQQQIFEKLQSELAEMEQRSAQQQAQIAENEKQWQQNQIELQREVESKQQQLQTTQQALNENKQQTDKEKQQQQVRLQKLQEELADAEKRSQQQDQQIQDAEQHWQEQQRSLEQELTQKQQKLQQTEQTLQKTKQQTEAEQAEKDKQQKTFEQLKAELVEMEQRSVQQQQKMQQHDKQWQESQLAFKQQIEDKQKELHSTQEKLNEIQQQSEKERRERAEQQQKLAQLKVELSDVESRAVKQQEMMHGSDEQWRQHHAEIEQQKQQLQQALEQAQQQNAQMKEKLQGSLKELQNAESQVSETQTAEQRLQEELNKAKNEAEALQQKLAQQETQELKLQQQLDEQQKALEDSEHSIDSLQNQQKHLTDELQHVQQEYSETKHHLTQQDDSQSELAEQLTRLEQELKSSKTQLSEKESALNEAQKKLHSSQEKLEEQEQELVSAHKEELKQAQQTQPVVEEQTPKDIPDFANLPMPSDPTVWFDLLSFLQKHPNAGPLPVALSTLMEDLAKAVTATDAAVMKDDERMILVNTRKLAFLAAKVNSAPLIDIATRLEADCQKKNVDNISIFWPNVKQSILTALRVIYSHLHG